ncbi:hypothetical protein BRO54_0909 [Geobacillus proteiniphilus]|uniref:Uncharacterized protein n=1 Tax=Geobacillus proteiniphilus TaxID=860353 RepID=A0A1Q5T5H7_9BACL|nr:hypothetical protein BRO54_0909 [Geobacillus proteiniphilus]
MKMMRKAISFILDAKNQRTTIFMKDPLSVGFSVYTLMTVD